MRRLCPLLLLLLSCDNRDPPVDYGLCQDAVQRTGYYPQSIERDLDILLVLDRSPAMQGRADALAQSLPRMVEALRSKKLNDKIPDVHIGAISADLGAGSYAVPGCNPGGDGARLLRAPRVPGCTPPSDPWISYIDGTTNIAAGAGDPIERVKEALSCVGTLGNGGCMFSQPLEAARRALDPALALNPGFLRKDAFLALVFVTSGDDCSAARPELFDPARTAALGPLSTFRCFEHGVSCDVIDSSTPDQRTGCKPAQGWLHDVEGYAAFFEGLKPPGRVMVVVISGPTTPVQLVVGADGAPELGPSCQTAVGRGTPAIRLEALADLFGSQGHFNEGTDTTLTQLQNVSICSPDYGPALRRLYNPIACTLGGQCLPGWPITRDCGLVCSAGAALGDGESCGSSCLDRADCVVYEAVSYGEQETRTEALPRCPRPLFEDPTRVDCGASCPCWRLVVKNHCSPTKDGSPFALEVLRDHNAPKGAVAVAKCETTIHAPGSLEMRSLQRCQ